MHRIKHTKNTDVWDKGIEVKTDYASAKQSYHAYLGAYAYGHDENVDYVSCCITDLSGSTFLMNETWIAPESESEPSQEI